MYITYYYVSLSIFEKERPIPEYKVKEKFANLVETMKVLKMHYDRL